MTRAAYERASGDPSALARQIAERLSLLQERLAADTPGAGSLARLDELLRDLEDQIAGREVREVRRQFLPDHVIDHLDDRTVHGRVTFSEFFYGSRRAVHGAATAAIFDEALGRVSLEGGRERTRTAYLKVDYRSIAPLNTELTFRGWTDRHEGRKLFLAGELRSGDTLIAEAQALYITLHPWQETDQREARPPARA
jgi:acyl-coenzyme A thioesterase PaaI-like protein